MNPIVGVIYHWLGGLASGSFYVPFRGVKRWSWETSWLVAGVFSWIIAPWFFAVLNTSDVITVLKETPGSVLGYSYLFGAAWGMGGLTFGLAMRYLGMSLGMAVALGYCTVFGTLIPPIYKGEFHQKLIVEPNGPWILAGLAVCVIGIIVTALAGRAKEAEMSDQQKRETVKEFDFKKGILVATFSGIMSAFFAFGLSAGDQIRETTMKVDLVNSATAAGKTAARAEEPGPDAVLDSPVLADLVKPAAIDAKTLAGIFEEPLTLKNTLAELQAATPPADAKVIASIQAKATAAAAKSTAALEVVQSAGTPLAARLLAFHSFIGAASPAVFSVIDNLTSFSEKETALNVAVSGADLPAIHSKHSLWTGLPVLIVVLLGGFTTNFIWCMMLNFKNKTGYQYFSSTPGKQSPSAKLAGPAHPNAELDGRDDPTPVPLVGNYVFAALAGVTWYFQFFFYSMGETQMGEYKFSSWTLHMASIILFSSIWGLALREWKGASAKSKGLLFTGLAILVLSTIIVGYANKIGAVTSGH